MMTNHHDYSDHSPPPPVSTVTVPIRTTTRTTSSSNDHHTILQQQQQSPPTLLLSKPTQESTTTTTSMTKITPPSLSSSVLLPQQPLSHALSTTSTTSDGEGGDHGNGGGGGSRDYLSSIGNGTDMRTYYSTSTHGTASSSHDSHNNPYISGVDSAAYQQQGGHQPDQQYQLLRRQQQQQLQEPTTSSGVMQGHHHSSSIQMLQQTQQEPEQQQQQQRYDRESTPWTLGSTDGTFALSLLLQEKSNQQEYLQQQQQLQQQITLLHEQPQQQQQQVDGDHPNNGIVVAAGGGGGTTTTEMDNPPPPHHHEGTSEYDLMNALTQKLQQHQLVQTDHNNNSSIPSSIDLQTDPSSLPSPLMMLSDDVLGAPPAFGASGATIGSTGEAAETTSKIPVLQQQDQQQQQQQETKNQEMMIPATVNVDHDVLMNTRGLYNEQGQPISQLPQHQQQHTTTTTIQVRSSEYYSETNPLLISSRTSHDDGIVLLQNKKSLYQELLFRQPSSAVEACLAAACEVMNFDIAEMWLRTGPKTHQLTNSHLRPTALEDSVRKDIVDVYYGDKSAERTHRLSPALCKRAKEANDIVWVTAHNAATSEALRCSISNVRTAVAVPVCHQTSNTNITILFFSIRRILVRPTSVEFLVHMSLAAGVASVNQLAEEGLMDRVVPQNNNTSQTRRNGDKYDNNGNSISGTQQALHHYYQQQHQTTPMNNLSRSEYSPAGDISSPGSSNSVRPRFDVKKSITGAPLDLQWRQLTNVEYLTDGTNSWIHTAVLNGRPVVVKTLKPECQDVAVAMNEIEGELAVHSKLDHVNIVSLLGAGLTSKGVRFVVMERLDGGTLTQMLGYETRIRDRRRRFWRKKILSFIDVLRVARSVAEAMMYCHETAVPGCVIMHRDLKPDNIGFTLDGTVKILDFGLSKIIEDADVDSDDVYTMTGETGSLRYMAPEVADGLPYNYTADVYSFGVILWELNASKKPYDGLNRELFYERVVHGGERPTIGRRWPAELTSLITDCWDADVSKRPRYRDIINRLDKIMLKEKGGVKLLPNHYSVPVPNVLLGNIPNSNNISSNNNNNSTNANNNNHGNESNNNNNKQKKFLPKLSGLIDRHSTWF